MEELLRFIAAFFVYYFITTVFGLILLKVIFGLGNFQFEMSGKRERLHIRKKILESLKKLRSGG